MVSRRIGKIVKTVQRIYEINVKLIVEMDIKI
jgi:hypothetical protein